MLLLLRFIAITSASVENSMNAGRIAQPANQPAGAITTGQQHNI
jgi:hypothetical protein